MPEKLINYGIDLNRGLILRCKGVWPYEEFVDFMLVEHVENGERSYGLMTISGYKAGMIFVIFPDESAANGGNGCAVSLSWLNLNWAKWGYIDCPLDEVYVLERLPPSKFDDF